MKIYSQPTQLKQTLVESLKSLESLERCILLDYPSYPNIGDHLIWLGTLFYLREVAQADITYVASHSGFSDSRLAQEPENRPILLQGGGNLGDLWTLHQDFRERIIAKYPNHPIVILPQSIFFSSLDNLKKTANIFNAHPQLTIFARDNYSYQLASEHFHKCQVLKAPDMFFKMMDLKGATDNKRSKSSILYFCRQDKEANNDFPPESLGLTDLVVEDWVSYTWMAKAPEDWPFYIPGTVRLIREGWQRGLATPREWLSRQQWNRRSHYTSQFKQIDQPKLQHRSWSMMHAGLYQLQQHRLVITNRLHGHLLCLCLGVPHVFLPNSYYKNELFYETWTQGIPFCRFVKEPDLVKPAVEELLSLSDSPG
ncbi:polysaccharide polymerase [Geitlerinema sp. P-1104]|uniref:polysaccharide pyruvyl transferase family protein n=1 Tax=Geitlerinema sp. P-1104 TaxID=2546230 RepID=UPI001476D9F8|nr:polysaccharide pyruvyl transferase family protein [Geitlerinema sp. P-1104]NMG60586.1 polysaccharide polymerase [Geitlerinema sp. P-1104]